MNTMAMLIRREFWEHRALWIAPVILCGAYILLFALSFGHLQMGAFGAQSSVRFHNADDHFGAFTSMQWAFSGLLVVLTSTVVFFYLSDCLYAERKDRSILFWKSLPVSDKATVLSKLLVGLVIVPFGVDLLAAVTNAITLGMMALRSSGSPWLGEAVDGNAAGWLGMNLAILANTSILVLWYSPLAAYQMLMSAWAKSSVLVWTILPPFAIALGERVAFGTSYFWALLMERLGPGRYDSYSHFEGDVSSINLLPALTRPDLWIGVAVAAALVFVTIRVRRLRDDS